RNDRDFGWCRLSNILSLAVMPITSDGYGLVQIRNPKAVSTDGDCYTSGIAENIHRYLDEVAQHKPRERIHPLELPRTTKTGNRWKGPLRLVTWKSAKVCSRRQKIADDKEHHASVQARPASSSPRRAGCLDLLG